MATLDEILSKKRREISETIRSGVDIVFREQAERQAPSRNFLEPLRRRDGRLAVIAEIKRASPSRGHMRDLDASATARLYERGGAAAISVLTDSHFEGDLEDLEAVEKAVAIPVLRKDFILDASQIYEARAAGADAVLLIVGIVGTNELVEFQALTKQLGMAALVEVSTAASLAEAISIGASIIGVNNRDLWSDAGISDPVDLRPAEDLIRDIPAEIVSVSMSGISKPQDAERLAVAGFDAILVGGYLTDAQDPLGEVERLSAIERQRSREAV